MYNISARITTSISISHILSLFFCENFLQIRSKKIFEASDALEKKEISAVTFLNRIVYRQNNICNSFDDFSLIDNSNEDIPDEDEDHVSNSQAQNEIRLMPCCVCYDEISQVTMHPCGHLKICAGCWNITLEQHEIKMKKFIERNLDEECRPTLKCAYCNVIVNTYIERTYA